MNLILMSLGYDSYRLADLLADSEQINSYEMPCNSLKVVSSILITKDKFKDRIMSVGFSSQTLLLTKTFTNLIYRDLSDVPETGRLRIIVVKAFAKLINFEYEQIDNIGSHVHGVLIKDGYRYVISTSGHAYTMMLGSHLLPFDWGRWFDEIELNIQMFYEIKNSNTKRKIEIMSGFDVYTTDTFKGGNGLWHSYFDYITAIHVYHFLALRVFGQRVTSFCTYLIMRFSKLVKKYPRFIYNSFLANDYIRSLGVDLEPYNEKGKEKIELPFKVIQSSWLDLTTIDN